MKRTAIKRKPKKKTVKKPAVKKPSLRLLKNKLWAECKRIIRARYEQNGMWRCYTCGALLDEPYKAQTAHFIPSAACGAYLRYDLRNLRTCCYYCNINLGGNGAEYYRRMVEEMGQDHVDQIFKDKQVSIKADEAWYKEMIAKYQVIHR